MSKVNILVPIKRVLDFQLKPRINKLATGIDKTGVKFSINPFCDIAVEEAVKIKKAHKSIVESIHSVSIGPAKSQDILRQSLAKGVDTSTLIDVGSEDVELEPLAIAKILQRIQQEKGSNLIILGKQAIDDDSNQVGQMLAGLLNWPQATNAAKVEVDDSGANVTVTREIDGGEETLRSSLPLIITTDLRLNEPKFVSLPNMMKAKKKKLDKLKLSDFQDLGLENRLEVLKVEEPPVREAGVRVSNVDELVGKLRDAKAI
jgi:electron transfer flavoprotein beta subunit